MKNKLLKMVLTATSVIAMSISGMFADFAFAHDLVDIDNSKWYAETVTKLVDSNIISGYEDKTFRPNATITGAEFVKLIICASGNTSIKPITDGSDYWAKPFLDEAISIGILEEAELDPTMPISREAMAVITYRAIQLKGEDVSSATYDTSTFSDYSKTSETYKTAMTKILGLGILTGKGDGILDPVGTATRAEASMLIARYLWPEYRQAYTAEVQSMWGVKFAHADSDHVMTAEEVLDYFYPDAPPENANTKIIYPATTTSFWYYTTPLKEAYIDDPSNPIYAKVKFTNENAEPRWILYGPTATREEMLQTITDNSYIRGSADATKSYTSNNFGYYISRYVKSEYAAVPNEKSYMNNALRTRMMKAGFAGTFSLDELYAYSIGFRGFEPPPSWAYSSHLFQSINPLFIITSIPKTLLESDPEFSVCRDRYTEYKETYLDFLTLFDSNDEFFNTYAYDKEAFIRSKAVITSGPFATTESILNYLQCSYFKSYRETYIALVRANEEHTKLIKQQQGTQRSIAINQATFGTSTIYYSTGTLPRISQLSDTQYLEENKIDINYADFFCRMGQDLGYRSNSIGHGSNNVRWVHYFSEEWEAELDSLKGDEGRIDEYIALINKYIKKFGNPESPSYVANLEHVKDPTYCRLKTHGINRDEYIEYNIPLPQGTGLLNP